ncbi:ornithine carbamoyltransferase 1 [Gymnopilus junonius]|uniref:ornithine carbamoyltransferase n=1 Tax=Gymnopilus junonius TaxID=109634 RepID=A0A9P5NGX2_GYMJU|nr:ornithine carbamoyltransferase 1 [Gymnopilus junonius]
MSPKLRHLMSLADLTAPEINRLVSHAYALKNRSKPWLTPADFERQKNKNLRLPSQSLFAKTIALLFSKRSTRTRIAAETSAELLGGRALFLGQDDIQLGVNESPRDTAQVISSMCQGIFARVGEHSEVEELAKYSEVPVLNALSSLWHPTQILADLLTLHEHAESFNSTQLKSEASKRLVKLPKLRPLTIAYVGDSANVLHDMLVTYPRLGHSLRVASPPQYRAPTEVWDRVKELGCEEKIIWVDDPKEAVHKANVVVTDTWISMGQEAEKEERLRAFHGYQVNETLCREGGADPNWKFLHCLPRKPHEVDDEVFYGARSLVFPEAENRKWTIMAAFDLLFGKWQLGIPEGTEAEWEVDGAEEKQQ